MSGDGEEEEANEASEAWVGSTVGYGLVRKQEVATALGEAGA